MKKIEAKIIADSKNVFGDRITTFILTFPRFILAELNTHRLFSRNSASSRAIPFKKMVKMVEEDPFIPIAWQKDHKGMQGSEYFEGEEKERLIEKWVDASKSSCRHARVLNNQGDGVTKQLCNRILEPYMWHTVIVTATDFENFISLRANLEAEIHIKDLAEKILEEYNKSTPKLLKEGEWHIPFVDSINSTILDIESRIKIATAKCARVSYMNHEGKNDYNSDLVLHDRLLESGHFSPFEHCAKSMTEEDYVNNVRWDVSTDLDGAKGWCGNFKGFIQYRKTLQNECRTDDRVFKK